ASAGLDLARGETTMGSGLQTELAKADKVGIVTQTAVAALVHLAILGSFWLQHDNAPYFAAGSRRPSPPRRESRRESPPRRGDLSSFSASACAASRSKILPL